MASAEFPVPEDLGHREWGTETLLLLAPGKYTLKRIEMKRGAKGGLQYHRMKDEGGVMISGEMKVYFDCGGSLGYTVLGPGDAFHFPAGAVHQAEALTECVYIEASTPYFNDRVHVEDQYGIEKEAGGLKSTEMSEIELR